MGMMGAHVDHDVLVHRNFIVVCLTVLLCVCGMVHCEKNRHAVELDKARNGCPGEIPIKPAGVTDDGGMGSVETLFQGELL